MKQFDTEIPTTLDAALEAAAKAKNRHKGEAARIILAAVAPKLAAIAVGARAFTAHPLAQENRVPLRLRIADDLKLTLDTTAPVAVTSKAGIGTLAMIGAAVAGIGNATLRDNPELLADRFPLHELQPLMAERLASYL